MAYFNQSEYSLLLVTGDLGSGTRQNGVAIARALARLEKPTLVVAGNNDAPFGDEIATEFRFQTGLVQLLELVSGAHDPAASAGHVSLCGYDLRTVTLGARTVSIVVGRPYAMGGNELSFPEPLARRYGITSMADSEARLRDLVERAPSEELLFLAHNGPAGLGHTRDDIWGCDFRPEEGDWGDEDLRAAVEHARGVGKRVLAVIAGHMHRRDGGERAAMRREQGVLYVNAALVPRIHSTADGLRRHHMRLWLDADGARAEDVFVADYDATVDG